MRVGERVRATEKDIKVKDWEVFIQRLYDKEIVKYVNSHDKGLLFL